MLFHSKLLVYQRVQQVAHAGKIWQDPGSSELAGWNAMDIQLYQLFWCEQQGILRFWAIPLGGSSHES